MKQSGYDPQTIEPRWQDRWEAEGAFRAHDDDDRPKKYVLDMFPYPSGDGLHLGHVINYTISDVIARHARMLGFNVLHPTGWDAFGLPAEVYAITEQIHPREAVERNIEIFKRQMKRMGWSIDWSREINTTDPRYFKWTQWIFLKLLEMDLAYEAEVPVNWCPELGTVLANEEVIDGKSERGGHPVVRKPMRQWLLRITAYADRLLEDLDELEWSDHLKQMQREWIGRSEGAEVRFHIPAAGDFTVFTTRPDTLFGATFCVLAPEHALVERITTDDHRSEVAAYVEQTARRSERDRLADVKHKSGVFTGAYARNPVNGEDIPVWIADYVLPTYGSGAVMAVPGHDQRDWEFARAFDIPIREVVRGGDLEEAAHEGDGEMVNSSFLDGLSVADAKERIVAWLAEQGHGRKQVQYRLRDWLFSRQRYWGEPFPVVRTQDGEVVPVPTEALPVELPEVESYQPTGTGESPLAAIDDWVRTTDPRTGAPALRETNTMPQWAGSCWYYLRFADPHNDRAFVGRDREAYWLPVDVYVGGAEHAVLHLLYARFWHKVLYDLGVVHTKEPFLRLVNQGMIRTSSYREAENSPYLAPEAVEVRDGTAIVKATGEPAYTVVEKMSKSKKNVINPDGYVGEYGADTLRLYMLFMGPAEADKVWSRSDIEGIWRFLNRAWRLLAGDERFPPVPLTDAAPDDADRALLHRTVAGVSKDMETLAFNTAISKLMVLLNRMIALASPETSGDGLPREVAEAFLRMLAPLGPHIAEELWSRSGGDGFVSLASWPTYDPALLAEETAELAVQVNGRVRARLRVPVDQPEAETLAQAKALPNVQAHLEGKTVRKEMVVPGRLVVLVAN
ncbi:MAG: leucine--tRNA ligase [Planctomycetota bacterium]